MTRYIARAVEGTTWRDRAPDMLRDTLTGPCGEPCTTTTDRRWLWRMEHFLAIYGTNQRQHDAGRDLHEYLQETCEHHWDDPDGYHYRQPDSPDDPKIRQCVWCSHVEDVAP